MEQQQIDEDITHLIVSVRNSLHQGDRDRALKTLEDIERQLHHYRGSDRVYELFRKSHQKALECASGDLEPSKIKFSPGYREFQDVLGEAVVLVRPNGLEKLSDSGDDLSATRVY